MDYFGVLGSFVNFLWKKPYMYLGIYKFECKNCNLEWQGLMMGLLWICLEYLLCYN